MKRMENLSYEENLKAKRLADKFVMGTASEKDIKWLKKHGLIIKKDDYMEIKEEELTEEYIGSKIQEILELRDEMINAISIMQAIGDVNDPEFLVTLHANYNYCVMCSCRVEKLLRAYAKKVNLTDNDVELILDRYQLGEKYK